MHLSNPIFHEFVALGLVNPENLEIFSERTRDREIPVYRDRNSKIVFLAHAATSAEYYESKNVADPGSGKVVVSTGNGKSQNLPMLEDSRRRLLQFEDEIRGQVLCDFGTGSGSFLNLAVQAVAKCCGVELRRQFLDQIVGSGSDIDVRSKITDFDFPFDVVTMFHVLEHIPTQVGAMREVLAALRPGGKVIVEVPHAEDFLIQSVDLPEFKAFTFWSEHLVLHTQASLRTVMEEAGFRDVAILPFQRYGFTNHLRWFLDRKPEGHSVYSGFENSDLEAAYKAAREADFTCDTLIAIGLK